MIHFTAVTTITFAAMQMHETYIRRCLELAQRGKGDVTPNPMVGALLVHEGKIIGEGWHQQYGQAHAEVNALESVAEENKRLIPYSTMYVSLEPCAHHGHTPPCAERTVKEGIKLVVVCNDDPYPRVSGRGYVILKDAGVEVIRGVLEREGVWVNRRFFCAQEQNRPYIILKWAQTQNGFFAPLNRTRYQMSNKLSQTLVHRWRTEEGAILIGTNTALHDDPQLTARLWEGKQPLRIVLDRHAVLPSNLRILNGETDTIVITETAKELKENLRYIQANFENDLLREVLEIIKQQGKQSLIVEGGTHTLQHFINAGLWDEARVFTTPSLLSDGIAAPVLRDGIACFSTAVDSDMLHVYTRSGNPYTYAPGMEL